MPRPVRALPVVQNWDCHSCGNCCRSYAVPVTGAEAARIEAQNWGFVGTIPDGDGHRLAHTDAGACVFLGPDNQCRIHAQFGAAAKPLACRLYPFVLVPAGDHWRVSLRLACPSAAANSGRPLADHAADLATYARELEVDAASGAAFPPPELKAAQPTNWPDALRFTACLVELITDPSDPVERRLRKVLAVADLCKKSRFESVSGKRLTEFLDVIRTAVSEDVPAAESVPAPSRVGRTIFRQVTALYARRDNGPHTGISSRGRWTRMKAAFRFARGRGRVPAVHGRISPAATFAITDAPWGKLPPESEALLARYLLVKLDSLQFTGPTNHDRPYWAGLDALALTVPVILWMARAFAADGSLTRADAVRAAVEQVDDHFGFNKLLATPRLNWGIDTLANRGDLIRLIAWYGR